MYTDVLAHPFGARMSLMPFVPSVQRITIFIHVPLSGWLVTINGGITRYPHSVFAAVSPAVSNGIHLNPIESSAVGHRHFLA